jgi:hypothetical protein
MISGINGSYHGIHNVFITTLIYKIQYKESLQYQVLGIPNIPTNTTLVWRVESFTVQRHNLVYTVAQLGEALRCQA